MREWLSGRALPCQGKCREFESRLPLQTYDNDISCLFFVLKQKKLANIASFSGAVGRTRTGTESPPRDFKSLVSAIPPQRH